LSLPAATDAPLDEAAGRVLETLQRRGASFVTDLARETELPPSGVRSALWVLLRRRLVTNDHFDVIRQGEEEAASNPAVVGTRRGALSLRRRAVSARPEGRWSVIPWGPADPEAQAVFQASLLLQRYGVAARELALLDPWQLPWRMLYEVLTRLELAGE